MKPALPRIATRLRALLILAAAIAPMAETPAQETRPDGGLPDAAVQQIMDVARSHITKAQMPDGSFVPSETPEELARPLLPITDGRRIIAAASLSAAAEWCTVEWQESHYLPLMQLERASRGWSDKQIAFIGLLHGITQATMVRQHRTTGACDDETQKLVRGAIDRWWGR